jgi:hypothetical protein
MEPTGNGGGAGDDATDGPEDKTNDNDIIQPASFQKVKKVEGETMPLWSSSRGCV